MTVVEPPLIRYKDLEINLDPDPTKFMTFPMTVGTSLLQLL